MNQFINELSRSYSMLTPIQVLFLAIAIGSCIAVLFRWKESYLIALSAVIYVAPMVLPTVLRSMFR